MKSKDIFKQLLPGVIVGLVLGFCLTMLVGVNTENPIPNFIGGAMCCLIPTLLNTIIVLFGTAKHLNRKLSFGTALLMTIPYAIVAGAIGVLVVSLIVTQIMGINTCELSTIVTAIYEAILGVVVSTLFAYFALKSYEKKVKYTRRDK